jgi:NADH:ubiquinone oxidoreductase subunit F (NADH-binding)
VTQEPATREPGAAGLPRLLPPDIPPNTGQAEDWRAHTARHGGIPYRGAPGRLIGDVEASGLTGRGGAGFPAGRKLAAVLEASVRRSARPVVVANGAETEPASDKDATLLWLAPHLVLDGLQLVAEAVGADRAVLYTHAGRAGDVGSRLRQALAQRRDDRITVGLAVAPPRFLAGQETALVNHLDDGPAIPRFGVPRITERGLGGDPTLVQNAETLAHIALIARHGPGWFREVGIPHEPGSLLVTVRRPDGRPRVLEVPSGTAIEDLTGVQNGTGTVLIGGYHGTWVPATRAAKLRLDNESLAAVGASVGAGIIVALPGDRCGLVESARVVRYLALESAGQCGPCLNGLPRMSAALTALARGRAPKGTRADLERWAGLVTGRGACHHPDGTARFVASTLRTFAAEVDRHGRGQCGATNAAPFLPVPEGAARVEEDWL